ncbi:hypothetical protein [Psychroserpens mesophilus]|uniref:hypothetical protein n=1 Tax=Psychroserpens mesophilus TaxID=325473 RepID=UPI001269D6D7|nr:hypothetical protein [Psychroserpens mesophilus]
MQFIFKLFIASMLCTSFFVSGQTDQIKIQKSVITKDKKKHSELVFSCSNDDGGVLIVRQFFGGLMRMPKGYYLEYYDENLNLLANTEMEMDDSGIKNIFIKDNQVNIIEYRKNKDDKTNDYYILTADPSKLQFSDKKLFSIDRKDVKKPFFVGIGFIPISNMGQIDHDPTGEVQVSTNNEFIAFNFDIKDDKNETHQIIVYNSNWEKVIDETIKEDIRDKYFQYNSFSVSDIDGSVYYLGKAYKNDSFRDKVKGEINYNYIVYKVSASGASSSVFNTENHYIQSMSILLDGDKLYTLGSYSDKDSDDYKGICYFKLNSETLNIENTTFNEFTEQFMIDKYGEKKGKRKKKKEKELPFLTYRDFIVDQNGDIYFNAEEFYITTHTSMGTNGSMRTYTVLHYDDIYACKLDSSGELQWIRTINKRQATSGGLSSYLSFSSTVVNGNMYIFLNGADDVKKLKDDRIQFKQKKVKKLNLYVIEIQPDGTFNYDIIVDDKDSKMTYKTKYGVMSEDGNSILFEGNKKKDKQVLKLTF